MQPIIAILLVLLGIVAGAVVGYLAHSLLSGEKEGESRSLVEPAAQGQEAGPLPAPGQEAVPLSVQEQQFEASPSPAEPPSPTGSLEKPLDLPMPPAQTEFPITDTSNLEEVIRLWKDQRDQSLMVEIGGKKARLWADLNDLEMNLVTRALESLSIWSGRNALPLTPTGVVTAPEPTPTPLAASQEVRSVRAGLDPRKVLRKAVDMDVRTPPEKVKSLAEQVDEILQKRITESPLAGRKISLSDAPDGGLLVLVGNEKYYGVDEVPDDQVRNMIRDAVEEWKKLSLSGTRS
jgi:hypothetical protein